MSSLLPSPRWLSAPHCKRLQVGGRPPPDFARVRHAWERHLACLLSPLGGAQSREESQAWQHEGSPLSPGPPSPTATGTCSAAGGPSPLQRPGNGRPGGEGAVRGVGKDVLAWSRCGRHRGSGKGARGSVWGGHMPPNPKIAPPSRVTGYFCCFSDLSWSVAAEGQSGASVKHPRAQIVSKSPGFGKLWN